MRLLPIVAYVAACAASYWMFWTEHDVVRGYVAAWFTALWAAALVRPGNREAAVIGTAFAGLGLLLRVVDPHPKAHEVPVMGTMLVSAAAFVVPVYVDRMAIAVLTRLGHEPRERIEGRLTARTRRP